MSALCVCEKGKGGVDGQGRAGMACGRCWQAGRQVAGRITVQWDRQAAAGVCAAS